VHSRLDVTRRWLEHWGHHKIFVQAQWDPVAGSRRARRMGCRPVLVRDRKSPVPKSTARKWPTCAGSSEPWPASRTSTERPVGRCLPNRLAGNGLRRFRNYQVT